MQLLKRLLLLGHYFSLSFGLAILIGTSISMFYVLNHFFVNDFEISVEVYRSSMDRLIQPITFISFVLVILTRIAAFFNNQLKIHLVDKLDYPILKLFNRK